MPEKGEFAGKVVLVTGSAQPNGIGAAIAERLAQFGATVVIHGREENRSSAQKVLDKVQSLGVRAGYQIVEQKTGGENHGS